MKEKWHQEIKQTTNIEMKEKSEIKIVHCVLRETEPFSMEFYPEIREVDFVDKCTISRNGGLKFTFQKSIRYIPEKDFDAYVLNKISNTMVLIFTKPYDQNIALEVFRKHFVQDFENKIQDLNRSIDSWNKLLKK